MSSTLKSYPEYAELGKKEIVELKRQFYDYCQKEEKAVLYEDKVSFEEESVVFREEKARLYMEKAVFQEEKARLNEEKRTGESDLEFDEEPERIGPKTEKFDEKVEGFAAEMGARQSMELSEKGPVFSELCRKRRRPHKKYVEAFINNISVPKSLEELSEFFMDGNHAQSLFDYASVSGTACWTVPRWAKRGDIVLFMHAKTANSTLTGLRTEVRTQYDPNSSEAQEYERAIADQLAFHKIYGGKIYAVGRVNGKPEKQTVDPLLHSQSTIFCDIDNLCLFDAPIDISEFNSYIKISRISGITPVFGEPYEKLKETISQKNKIPGYFARSFSTPFPHSAVNSENWMKLGLEYRNAFSLEIQFRQCYVDYLLRALGDQKTIYMECACYKGTNLITFVDNVIRISKKLLPVEVKLNIKLESDLEGQCEQYCMLDKLVLQKKTGREARINDVIPDRVLVIDTYAVYMFFLKNKKIETLYDLDQLKSAANIRDLRKIVMENLSCCP